MKKRTLGTNENRKNVSPELCGEYIDTLKKMVDCKTVFTNDGKNQTDFDKFYKVIEECFPTLCEKAQRLTFGSGCFLAKWCVKKASQSGGFFMCGVISCI